MLKIHDARKYTEDVTQFTKPFETAIRQRADIGRESKAD